MVHLSVPHSPASSRSRLTAATLTAILSAAAFGVAAGPATAAPGDLLVVDPPAVGAPDGSHPTIEAALSGNGRFIALNDGTKCFDPSLAALTGYECRNEQNILRYDAQTGVTDLISGRGTFNFRSGPSSFNLFGRPQAPTISADGQTVAFIYNGNYPDADSSFVMRSTSPGSATEVAGDGHPVNDVEDFSYGPVLTADGRSISFWTVPYGGACDGQAGYLWSTPDGDTAKGTETELGNNCTTPSATNPAGATFATVSADGTKVVFIGAENTLWVYDVASKVTKRIPLPAGARAAAHPGISGNGRYAFYTTVEGTDDAPTNGAWLADLQTGTSVRIAAATTTDSGRYALAGSLSGDGRYTAFTWPADPATGTPFPADTSRAYVYDRQTKTTKLVSKRSPAAGNTPFATTRAAAGISADGRFVSFVAADASQAVADGTAPAGARAIRADVLGPVGDVTPPPAPSFNAQTKVNGTSITLVWNPVNDSSGGQVTYRVRLRTVAGKAVGNTGEQATTDTTTTLSGLKAGTAYRVALTAEDPNGNVSTATTATFTTPGAADPTPPVITSSLGSGERGTGGVIYIQGTDLANVSGVLVGGVPAAKIIKVAADEVVAFAPPSTQVRSRPITLTGPFGSVAAGRFLYTEQTYRQPETE